MDDLVTFLAARLADPGVGWSVGTFGAIAEFTREADEPVEVVRSGDGFGVITGKGALRVQPTAGLRLIASESLTSDGWSHRVALCLADEACAMNGRMVLAELGRDDGALRPVDRDSILFDLGLGTRQVDICIRVDDGEVIAALRDCVGRPVFAPTSRAMPIMLAANPHRVFISRVARAEVYQPIPPPGGRSPDGPHTHVLPKLLAHGRTHAATEMLPEGWIPCAHFYPPHPMRDALGRARPFQPRFQDDFQALLACFGDQKIGPMKRLVVDAVRHGRGPDADALPNDRAARTVVRVALRQLQGAGERSPALAAWQAAFDRPGPDDAEDPMEALH